MVIAQEVSLIPRLALGLTAIVLALAATPILHPSTPTVYADIGAQSDMYGDQMIPPVRTLAWGFVRFFFNAQKTEADYTVDVKGLSGSLITGADMHRGQRGTNGPVIRHLADGDFLTTGGHMKFTTADLDDIAAGNWYAVVRTTEHPDGELRGQIVLPAGFWPTAPAVVAPDPTQLVPQAIFALAPAPIAIPAPQPAPQASQQVLALPNVSCGATASVTFNWTPARQSLVQWLDLSYDDNNFAEGTFYSYGPLYPSDKTLIWDLLPPNTPFYWRVNALTPSGWLPTATGSFIACG
jgi:hypothetical protein